MRVSQELSREDRDLVVTIKDGTGKVLAVRRWEGAASYIVQQPGLQVKGCLTMIVPKVLGLELS